MVYSELKSLGADYRLSENPNFKYIDYYDQDGLRHREDGPASITIRKSNNLVAVERYYFRGVLHRVGGPALVSFDHGPEFMQPLTIGYFVNGLYHREDGPAKIYHRISNEIQEEYALLDVFMTKDKFDWIIEHHLENIPLYEWNDELKVLFRLTF